MRISLNWLKRYVEFSLPPEELAQKLTMVGFEVESIEHLGEKYNNFVAGEVCEVSKHPHASKLTLCKVNIGKEVVQIVCGAPNVIAGQKVSIGLVGAEVPRNLHDPYGKPFRLTQANIRGEDSFGMICSSYELDLGEDKDGILVLDHQVIPGTPLAEYLGLNDTVFEIGITPNRPDAMSHIGIAREIGAIVGSVLNIPKIKIRESKKRIKDYASVKIEDKINCPRYTARVLFNIKLGPSPEWLQSLLSAIGIRPVNNIVDVTNFILMECGHPLHAFDYDKLIGHAIVVKCAEDGQSFFALDHKERKLKNDTLMIFDAEKPVAIAGIMGGENTEITGSTTNVLIESAYFNPRSIRRTSKYFGLASDASQHFERGANPNITQWAVDRVAGLIQEICGGEVLKSSIDFYPKKILPRTVALRVEKTNQILGTTLGVKEVTDLLKKIEIKSAKPDPKKKSSTKLNFKIPTYRPDIEREIDLIEEVARIYGYDNIETKAITLLSFSENASIVDFSDELRDWLVNDGFHEVVANSMQDKTIASLGSSDIVEIHNPISKEMNALRSSLVPGMLEIIRNNIFHGTKDLRLFEIGKIYLHGSAPEKQQFITEYIEEERLLLAFSGMSNPQIWSEKPRLVDIYDAKGEVQILFQKIFLDKYKFIPYSTTNALTESGLSIEINGEEIGFVGTVHKDLLTKFEIGQEVFIAEVSMKNLSDNQERKRKYKSLPKYPPVMRDVAFVVDEKLPIQALKEEIHRAGIPWLTKVELFDIYRGENISKEKKSCAFALEFQAEDHTLTQDEIDHLMQDIIKQVFNKVNGTLRT
jgi:phenylalanyl-tRNA synthetase beta chain